MLFLSADTPPVQAPGLWKRKKLLFLSADTPPVRAPGLWKRKIWQKWHFRVTFVFCRWGRWGHCSKFLNFLNKFNLTSHRLSENFSHNIRVFSTLNTIFNPFYFCSNHCKFLSVIIESNYRKNITIVNVTAVLLQSIFKSVINLTNF